MGPGFLLSRPRIAACAQASRRNVLSFHQSLSHRRPSCQQRRPAGRPRHHASRPLTVATSEHWWEDEEEFDSLTDSLKPKNVLLVAVPAQPARPEALQQLRAALQRVVFNTAVSSAQLEESQFARELWAGRDGPPYFFKVRGRPALDEAAADLQAARAIWQELLSQNWRVELDYGLGVEVPSDESLLVVCSAPAVQRLLEAAGLGGSSSGGVQAGAVAVVHCEGGAGGEAASWEALPKQLALCTQELGGLGDLQALLYGTKAVADT